MVDDPLTAVGPRMLLNSTETSEQETHFLSRIGFDVHTYIFPSLIDNITRDIDDSSSNNVPRFAVRLVLTRNLISTSPSDAHVLS